MVKDFGGYNLFGIHLERLPLPLWPAGSKGPSSTFHSITMSRLRSQECYAPKKYPEPHGCVVRDTELLIQHLI